MVAPSQPLRSRVGYFGYVSGDSWLCLPPLVLSAVTSTVKQALQESLVQILQPQRRVDMLRDIMDAQRRQRPYVVTFCGVNGVGKSTNLAKVSVVLQSDADVFYYCFKTLALDNIFLNSFADFFLAIRKWLQCAYSCL